MRRPLARLLIVSLVVLAPRMASAGPPLLCFPMVAGDAPSLPWGTGGWNSPMDSYDRTRLAEDTLALLKPDAAVLARMETLRRAVIYASTDATAATALFTALRVRLAKAEGTPAMPLAQFDLGYAVEAIRQARRDPARSRAADPPDDGYALIRRALAARGNDPSMEYAAALVTAGRNVRGASNAHLDRAMAGAQPGSDLARTIAAHQPLWGTRLSAAAR